MQQEVQQLQAQVTQLKARVLDSMDATLQANEALGAVAQAINYQGQDLDGLIAAVSALAPKTESTESE